jgi:O-antigen/teichoic acid export membrane protein
MSFPDRPRGLGVSAVVNLAAGGVGALLNLLLAAVVARHLGVAAAGTYFIVVAAFMIAANIFELGADTGLVRFVSAARAVGQTEDVPRLMRTAIRPVLVGCALSIVATAVVLSAVGEIDGLSPWLLLGASAVAGALSMTALFLGVTRGLGDTFAYPVLLNLVLPAGRLAAIGVAVLAGWGVSGVLVAWLAPIPLVLVLAAAISWRLVRSVTRSRGREPDSGRQRSLEVSFWRFSAARGVSAGVEILLEWVDVLLVGALASPAEAAVYGVVTRCLRASEVVQQAARIVAGPQISAALARGDVAHVREVYGLISAAMIWLTWPFFIVLAVFGDQVLRIFGPGFTDGAIPMAVLAGAMALATAAGAVQTILLMGGRSTWQLADKTGALVLNVVLDLLFIPWWGISGAAIAWAVTIVVDTAIVLWQVQVLMRVRPSGGHLRLAVVQSLLLVAVPMLAVRGLFGSSATVLAATACGLAVLYLAAGWKTRHALGFPQLLAIRSFALTE